MRSFELLTRLTDVFRSRLGLRLGSGLGLACTSSDIFFMKEPVNNVMLSYLQVRLGLGLQLFVALPAVGVAVAKCGLCGVCGVCGLCGLCGVCVGLGLRQG